MADVMTAAATALQIAPPRRSIRGTPRRVWALLRLEGRGLDSLPGRRWLVYAAAIAVGVAFGALRPGIERFYPESALFVSLAVAFGLLGRTPAALLVIAYAIADGTWFVTRSGSLQPNLLYGRVVGWILLWVLAVVVPRFARRTAATTFGGVGGPGPRPLLRALASGVLLAGAAFGFMQLMAYLIGPAYPSRNPGIADIKVFQIDSLLIAPIAGIVLGAIELTLRRRLGDAADAVELLPSFPAFSVLGVVFRSVAFALVIFLFRGIISALPDILVLVAAFTIGEVGAFVIGRSSGPAATLRSIPGWLRAGVGILGTMGAGYILYIGRGGAFSVTEYFTWVVAIAVGYVLMRLLFATDGRDPRRVSPGGEGTQLRVPPGLSTLVVVGLLAVFAGAPPVVLADNCTGFFDCIGAALLAALAALAAAAAFIWNILKSLFMTLPPVISELEPLASEEGAQAQNDAITMLKNRVAMDALANGDTERADAIRSMSNGEFAQAASRGEFR